MLDRIYYMLNNIIIRLIVYYVAWLLALGGVFHLFPQILIYVTQERERFFAGQQGSGRADVSVTLGNIKEGVATLVEGNIKEALITLVDPAHTIPVMVALVLAFWVTLPITWLYRWTRPRKKYSQSFAHTLLVIPIAISLVVFSRQRQSCSCVQFGGHRGSCPFSHFTRRADGFRIHAYGYRDRTRGWHATYSGGVPCITGFCHHNAGGVEK